ncbi:hypothetical protein JG687_00001795 [Phytophthora cactorum]|uniref:Tetratricopeptide repeat n=1 Tax=Phytophthora cactorum TaxID=29920 RepID=A0A8T1UWD0_9STRA|nr:hypothetical protein JG687_00001795 [Phytophthora cactorum]
MADSPSKKKSMPSPIQKMERDAVNNIWTIWYASQYGKLERVRSLLDRNAVSSIDVQELKRVLEARELYAQCLPHAENLFGGADDHTVACTDALGKCCFLLGQFAEAEKYFKSSLAAITHLPAPSIVDNQETLSSSIGQDRFQRAQSNLAMVAVAAKSSSAVHAQLACLGYLLPS